MTLRNLIRPQFRLLALLMLVFVAATLPAAAAAPAGDAVEIQIPVLGIDANIKEFPLDGTSWAISPWETGIGHFQGTGWFDAPGNIALGGHSWMPGNTPGIFYKLETIKRGDEVIVIVNGEERRYAVSRITSVPLTDLAVLYPTATEQITLITCEPGSYDPNSARYERRVVVTARRED